MQIHRQVGRQVVEQLVGADAVFEEADRGQHHQPGVGVCQEIGNGLLGHRVLEGKVGKAEIGRPGHQPELLGAVADQHDLDALLASGFEHGTRIENHVEAVGRPVGAGVHEAGCCRPASGLARRKGGQVDPVGYVSDLPRSMPRAAISSRYSSTKTTMTVARRYRWSAMRRITRTKTPPVAPEISLYDSGHRSRTSKTKGGHPGDCPMWPRRRTGAGPAANEEPFRWAPADLEQVRHAFIEMAKVAMLATRRQSLAR